MNIMQSRAVAWAALILMVTVIIISICTHVVASIWEYSALFLAFMAVFSHLAALLLYKMSAIASKKLDNIAVVFGLLALVAFVVIFILNWCEFY